MNFLRPTSTEALPGGLSLTQYLQTILVGLTGIDGTLVRPSWQPEGPKQPDVHVNWIAFGVKESTPDANAYVGVGRDEQVGLQRQETLEIECSFYGPEAFTFYGFVRDGFQIQTNLTALRLANMGFVEVTRALRMPDLFGQRWIERQVASIFIRRYVQRIYPVATLVSANGTIHSFTGNEEWIVPWSTPAT